MKKKRIIRLLLLVCTFGYCVVFGISYYYITKQPEEIYEAEPELANEENGITVSEEDEEKSMESATIIPPVEYVLYEEDGYVVVYRADKKTIYANTDIRISRLSQELQEEIKEGKPVYSEAELYNFLESNSS